MDFFERGFKITILFKVGACSHRLTYRLEASLLAGIVLVHYFIAYLDLKLLMDYLQVCYFFLSKQILFFLLLFVI